MKTYKDFLGEAATFLPNNPIEHKEYGKIHKHYNVHQWKEHLSKRHRQFHVVMHSWPVRNKLMAMSWSGKPLGEFNTWKGSGWVAAS